MGIWHGICFLLHNMFNGCFRTVVDNRVENMCTGVNLSCAICQVTLFHWNRPRENSSRVWRCTSGTLGLLCTCDVAWLCIVRSSEIIYNFNLARLLTLFPLYFLFFVNVFLFLLIYIFVEVTVLNLHWLIFGHLGAVEHDVNTFIHYHLEANSCLFTLVITCVISLVVVSEHHTNISSV